MNYENMINKIVNDNSLNYIGNLILNNHEIQVLEQYNIDYKNCKDMKELLFILEEYEDEEIDEIIMSISERDYYRNSNK